MRRWLATTDAILQQAAWWTAVLCAADGSTLPAALAGGAVVALHLLARPGERSRVARTAAAAALYGLVTDSALSRAGLVRFVGAGLVSPPWMVGLWAAFGAGLTASLAGAARWPGPLLAVAAAAAGPIAYRAGGAIGAISFSPRPAPALATIGVQWAIGIPLLARAARATGGERAQGSSHRRAGGAGGSR